MVNPTQEKQPHVDEELAALSTNISAILAVTASVERTLGPKGLDTMLVDRFGDVLVTNSGVTILERIDVSHPAAQMLLEVAKAQHKQVGDGTTSATVMAGAILKEGLNQIARGVPVSRLLEGIEKATQLAVEIIEEQIAKPLEGLDDPALLDVARVAGREDLHVAKLVLEAAKTVGLLRLKNRAFKLAESILAQEGAEDKLIKGLVFAKKKVNPLMPNEVSKALILILEDSLSPLEIEEEALRTEIGFQRSLELKTRFLENLQKVISLGVNAIFIEGAISPEAEELLTHSKVFCVRRLTGREMEDVTAFTGAIPIKRSGLNREAKTLQGFFGKADSIQFLEPNSIFITGGKGKPRATLIVGASTKQVLDEKERKAQDAAASLQAALQSGVVPGGGAAELSTLQKLESHREQFKNMTSYGLDCVLEGLKKPFLQMAVNAGFKPLEKAEIILNEQAKQKNDSISINFDTGEISDMTKDHIVDPARVKVHALKSASEVAVAILRINRIIKMRENGNRTNGHSG